MRSWTHLERQRGGAGHGGPRRNADRGRPPAFAGQDRQGELEQVRRTRQLHRSKARPHPIVALVGYTNAGVDAVQPHRRGRAGGRHALRHARSGCCAGELPQGRTVILSDTRACIRPADPPSPPSARRWKRSWKPTRSSRGAYPIRTTVAQSSDVLRILRDRPGIDRRTVLFTIEVWNKIDRLEPEARDALVQKPNVVAVSATSGRGCRRCCPKSTSACPACRS